ncbi:unnamed protein product [Ectocarpus sp. 6 AP-2014]
MESKKDDVSTGSNSSRPPVEAGEMRRNHEAEGAPLTGGQTRNNSDLSTLSAPVLPTHVVGAGLYDHASSQNSIHEVQSSGYSSVASNDGGLEPPLLIGVNPLIVLNKATNPASIPQHDTDAAAAPRGEKLQPRSSRHELEFPGGSTERAATNSAPLAVDREVLVMREAAQSSDADPTPLGQHRRLSLFERAHSTIIYSSNEGKGGDGNNSEDSVPHARCDRSKSGVVVVNGRDIDAIGLEDRTTLINGDSTRGRDKYNTVLRDWLMHVVEKDDQQDAEQVQSIWATARRRRRLAHKTFEAADYELYDSKVWHTHKQDAANNNRGGTKGSKRHRKLVGRSLTLALGIAVGLTGCFVTFFTEWLVHAKLHFIAHIIEEHEGESDFKRYGTAFAWLWFINSLLTVGAFGMVWYQPWSNGSGIPETKCLLNGVSIPQVLAPSTLVTKVFGVILGVASGLPIGKEGPMIHAGAAIGGGIANIPGIPGVAEFRNDRDRRDLAAMGTAAGVAAAFRTPIGGVLFALEEGASFWTTFLTWRSFAAAVVTVVVYYLVFQGRNMFDEPLTASDIFVFGEFQDSDSSFYMWELPMFALIATLGGLLGAGFVACSKRMALFRARNLAGAKRPPPHIMVISSIMTTVAFFLPLAVGECRPIPTDLEGWSPSGVASIKRLVTLNCHHGEYNELGTLFLNEQDGTIKLLFHFGDGTLRSSSAVLFFGVFITLQCVASGVWVSNGQFIPAILSGAAMGRSIGELLGRNSRAYALVGGAGILGGITRMALSVTVMMVEASGWVLFVIPLMLVFIVARSVGNRFNEGIYDTQISIKKMPFLEQEPPEETRTQNMRANQLMSKEVVCLRPIETVEAIMTILRDYDHNCFPVVEDRDQRVLLGVVHRKNLAVLLMERHFTEPSAQDPTRPNDILPELSWSVLERSYPHYPMLQDIKIGGEHWHCLMDIAPYVQIGPHCINEHASAHRAYIMFRTLGLRHLVVVNHYNEVMGMITRENLLPEHFGAGGAYSRTQDVHDKLSAA